MTIKDNSQNVYDINKDLLDNFLRCMTMLEKALDRLARQNYYNRSQYPEIFIEIEDAVNTARAWVETYRVYSGFPVFQNLLTMLIIGITDQIVDLIGTVRPKPGIKVVKKTFRTRQREKLCDSVGLIIGNLAKYSDRLQNFESPMGDKIEKALIESFKEHCLEKHDRRRRNSVSKRGEKTRIFPCSDPDEYENLIGDRKRFRVEVVDNLKDRSAGHRPGCGCHTKYKMSGFRKSPRKTVMPGGRKREFRIRMIRCLSCGQRFSLLPSFIPREKHFSIDIIGQVLRASVLFAESVSAVLENVRHLCGRAIKSRQTVFNWLQWMGTHHPATLLTRAGLTGSGYFQEDEGFEKESGLRTYTVVMVDPRDMTVWHIDYTDHADEATLTSSFEDFLEKTDFKVLGISKDRWEPATSALKNVFHGVWIGFCHLHCLKKMSKALSVYQQETRCDNKEVNRLYKKFRKVLKTATSESNMNAKLTSLNDEAFKHPLLKKRVDELRENAVRYTSHKKRNGITITTSMADNFLKIIKRKLRQVGSFRDKECAKLFFNATANVRNFVPFVSGSKNAHNSPFIMAGGETFGLSSWIQIMNMHDAFLFTPNTL